MLVAGLGSGVPEAHGRQRDDGRVPTIEPLEQWCPEFSNGLFGEAREFLAVAFNNKAAEPAFEIGVCIPREFTGGAEMHIFWSRRRRGVGYCRVFDVLRPSGGHRLIREPHRFLQRTFKLRSRHGSHDICITGIEPFQISAMGA